MALGFTVVDGGTGGWWRRVANISDRRGGGRVGEEGESVRLGLVAKGGGNGGGWWVDHRTSAANIRRFAAGGVRSKRNGGQQLAGLASHWLDRACQS
ncbi:hypothetical protein Acr_00g0022730 [Actinidia rufa]|uniref:Uncharacterized protein n=1 Tax=Actinidia rufa TaxID=165716 RepID=A0A7J0DED3_9ERIC|nr:hypothetical protein Acr_00g0022730 [Actinidia rufa]